MKIETFIKYTIPIFLILNALRMFREMQFIYYVTQGMLLMYIVIAIKGYFARELMLVIKKDNYIFLLLLFPIFACLTTFWSHYPLTSFLKGVNYIFVIVGIYALIILWLKYINYSFYLLLLYANLFIVITNTFSLISGIPSDSWHVSHGLSFAGFFPYQNLMAGALLFTLPGLLYFQSLKVKHNRSNIFLGILIILNSTLIILSYSRTVILSIIIAIIVFLTLNKYYKFLFSLVVITFITLAMYFTIQPVNNLFTKLLSKHGYPIFATRTILWEPSFEAAKEGGIFGLGFGIGEPKYSYPFYTKQNNIDGASYREKGSIYLALIEETGVFGLILFLSVLFFLSIKIMKKLNATDRNIFISFITAICIYGIFENWSGGGYSLMQYYILLIIYCTVSDEKNIVRIWN